MDNRMKQLRSQPCVSSFANKLVVIQFRIGPIYPVNLLFLSGTESFLRIQAPNTLEQALSPQYFMQTGDAPREVVTCIKKRRIAIGHRYTLTLPVEKTAILASRYRSPISPGKKVLIPQPFLSRRTKFHPGPEDNVCSIRKRGNRTRIEQIATHCFDTVSVQSVFECRRRES